MKVEPCATNTTKYIDMDTKFDYVEGQKYKSQRK